MQRTVWLLSFPIALTLAGVSCDPDVLNDPGFQFWCGDQLCDWSVDGEVERVPTWHDNDYAVEMIGSPVILQQTFHSRVNGCVLVELIADIDPETLVTISINQDGLGGAEWTQVVNGIGFQRRTWRVDLNVDSGGFVRIRKDNPGRALIAGLRIWKGCSSIPPISESTAR